MIQGSGHAEDASYQTVYVNLDSGFCCFADSEKPKHVEVADTEVGMHVADIEQRQCMYKGSMAQEPYVHELEDRHLLLRHLLGLFLLSKTLRFLSH